jgi:cytochrome c-type protein NapC
MMPSPLTILFFLLGVTIVLLIVILARPALTLTVGGKILAFVTFVALPVLCGIWGLSEHFQRSEQTNFCLSCHIMEPYGRSLYVDDKDHIPAAHFQNHRIPADQACYTCHTDYAMYGSLRVKLNGLRHVYVEYLGTPKEPIHLYQPFQNSTCLHCHSGSRSFEDDTHTPMMDMLKSNQLSCISSGCHDTVHAIASLDKFKQWRPTE